MDALNEVAIAKVNEHLSAAVENVTAGIRYFRVQSDGPRIKEVSVKNPLTPRLIVNDKEKFVLFYLHIFIIDILLIMEIRRHSANTKR